MQFDHYAQVPRSVAEEIVSKASAWAQARSRPLPQENRRYGTSHWIRRS